MSSGLSLLSVQVHKKNFHFPTFANEARLPKIMKIYRQSWTKLLFLYVLSRGAKTSPPCFSVQPFSVHSEMLQFLPVPTCRCTVMYGMLWLRHRKLPLYNYQTFMFVSHSQPTHTRSTWLQASHKHPHTHKCICSQSRARVALHIWTIRAKSDSAMESELKFSLKLRKLLRKKLLKLLTYFEHNSAEQF